LVKMLESIYVFVFQVVYFLGEYAKIVLRMMKNLSTKLLSFPLCLFPLCYYIVAYDPGLSVHNIWVHYIIIHLHKIPNSRNPW
jgi:hypothetical protein